jgi:hypothetical protein
VVIENVRLSEGRGGTGSLSLTLDVSTFYRIAADGR